MIGKDCFSNLQLLDYLDSALAPSVVQELEKHLAGCATCATRLGQYRAIRFAVASLRSEKQSGGESEHVPEALLSGWAKGALPSVQHDRIRRHLQACLQCREKAAAFEQRERDRLERAMGTPLSCELPSYVPAGEPGSSRRRFAGWSVEVAACRDFKVRIERRKSQLYLSFRVEENEALGEVRAETPNHQIYNLEPVPRKQWLSYPLGSVEKLTGQSVVVSFDYRAHRWEREIRFK